VGGGGRVGGGGSRGGDDAKGPTSSEPEHPFFQAVLAVTIVVGAFLLIPVLIFAVAVLFDLAVAGFAAVP
jgi:hypothetical protein